MLYILQYLSGFGNRLLFGLEMHADFIKYGPIVVLCQPFALGLSYVHDIYYVNSLWYNLELKYLNHFDGGQMELLYGVYTITL